MIAHHFERNVMPCAPSYYPFCNDVSGDYRNPVSWLTHGIDVIHGRIEYAQATFREADEAEKERAMAFLPSELESTVAAWARSCSWSTCR
jgi:hypothetical protein